MSDSSTTILDLAASHGLPENFLKEPREGIVAKKIDFSDSTLPEYKDCYACILDNVLSAEECAQVLRLAEASTNGVWHRAAINTGAGNQRVIAEERNCGRIVYDSPWLASLIWQRIATVPEVQEILRLDNRPSVVGSGPMRRKQIWRLTRANERLRFLRYVGGEFFRAHCDGTYVSPNGKERSFFTLQLYLSDSVAAASGGPTPCSGSQEECQGPAVSSVIGGATCFHAMNLDRRRDIAVAPAAGRILLFQQRSLLHSGDDVEQGVKYTMRTDLLYALEPTEMEDGRVAGPLAPSEATSSED